jgi:MFS family permease
MLACACLGWSLCTFISGFAEQVWLIIIARLGLGLFQSGCGSPAYSLIADYFPPERRTFANSVYNLGIYIGQSFSSLTIIMINWVGWRGSFQVIGGAGLLFGLIGLIMIKEPKRGRYDVDMSHENPKVKKQSEKPNGAKNLIKNYIKGFAEIFKNPCSRWTIIAGCLRFWAGNAVGYYTGKYFNIYPDKVVRFCAVKFLFK